MADYLYLTSTGVIVPSTEAILSEVQAEYQAVFGTDTIMTPDTPQGVLATGDTLARVETVQNNAAVANQINPNLAVGVFLDAIMALTGIERTAATRTLVSGVTLTGVSSTVIPVGTQAATDNGDIFETLEEVTITGGTATATFRAIEYGPVACGIGDLTQIVSNVNGWETVTNPTAGILGQNTQSDQAARAKRNNTLAFQGVALPEAITSALYNVEGVRSLYFQENIAATEETISGIVMAPHSIWVCVDGGSDTDVAAALLENKSLGCAWNGGEEVTVIEPASGQEYTVKFDRPDSVEFMVRVTTPNGSSTQVKQAVVAWANGEVSGLEGLKIGTDVSPFEIAAGINGVYPEIYVSKVEIAIADMSPSWSTDVLVIAVDELAFTSEGNVTVILP